MYVPRGPLGHDPCVGFMVLGGYPLGTMHVCNKSIQYLWRHFPVNSTD